MTVQQPTIARNFAQRLVACLLVSLLANSAQAQLDVMSEHYADSDLRFFQPVDFDFDDRPISKGSGYFFKYDKLSWAITGERTTIGDPNVVETSELIYPGLNPLDDGAPPAPYVVENSLQDAGPQADFGWGNRFEFGIAEKNGNSWSVSVLEGPEVNQRQIFGNLPNALGDSGFGSIAINFVTPPGYLLGFRDYFSIFPPVDDGPGGTSIFIDDLDGDGNSGFILLVGGGFAMDFDDAHEFNITFDQLTVRNHTQTNGIEIMRNVMLDNRHKMAKHQNRSMQLGYGVRFFRLRDRFSFEGVSPLLRGTNFVITEAENQIVGPQIRAKWATQRRRWNMSVDGRFVFGYNVQDLDQNGILGENLTSGGSDQPFIAQPNTFNSGAREDDFSPLAELRVDASYQLTSSIAANLGYTAIFIDNISRASQLVTYRLPNMGLREGGQQHVLINGVNFGFDVVY